MEYRSEEKPCEVCGSTNSKLLWEKKSWSKTILLKNGPVLFHHKDVMCLDCGLVYKNPMLTRDCVKEFYNGPYAALYKPYNAGGISKAHIIEGVVRTVGMLDFLAEAQIDLKDKKVFEVGVGMGILLKGIQSLGGHVSGLDFDARSCEIAKKLFAFDVNHMDVELYNSEEKYDLIFMCNTLEHFYSPRELLHKLQLLLADDGKLVIEVPSYHYPYVHAVVDAFFSSAHNYTFDYFSFCNLTEQCGYKVEYWGHNGHNKVMQFVLARDNKKQPPRGKSSYNDVLKKLEEQDVVRHKISEINKELFRSTDVSSIIERVLAELPHTSNQAFLSLATPLLEAGRNKQVIGFMEQYREGQSGNTDICFATFLYFKGLALRQMGDFLAAKRCFMDAKENYPRFETYNFIEELKIDGIISDSGFAHYTWWNNNKMLESLG